MVAALDRCDGSGRSRRPATRSSRSRGPSARSSTRSRARSGTILDPVAEALDPVLEPAGDVARPGRGNRRHDPRPGRGRGRHDHRAGGRGARPGRRDHGRRPRPGAPRRSATCSSRSRGPSARSSTRSPTRSGTITEPVADGPPRPGAEPVGDVLEPVAGTVGTILDPVAGAVGTITEPVAGALDPVLEPVGDVLEPGRRPLGTVLDPVGDTVGTVDPPCDRSPTNPVAATVEPQTPAAMGTASDAAGRRLRAERRRLGDRPEPGSRPPQPRRGSSPASPPSIAAISSALLASDSSRAPPTRFASEASGANQPTLRELTPLLDPSLSATPKQLASVPGELSTSRPAPRAARGLRRPGQPRRRRRERRCFSGPSLRLRPFSAGLHGSPRDRPVRLAVGGDRRPSRAPWLGPRPSRSRRAPTGARRRTTREGEHNAKENPCRTCTRHAHRPRSRRSCWPRCRRPPRRRATGSPRRPRRH